MQKYISKKNLNIGYILHIFLKFWKLQSQYCYKEYSHISERECNRPLKLLMVLWTWSGFLAIALSWNTIVDNVVDSKNVIGKCNCMFLLSFSDCSSSLWKMSTTFSGIINWYAWFGDKKKKIEKWFVFTRDSQVVHTSVPNLLQQLLLQLSPQTKFFYLQLHGNEAKGVNTMENDPLASFVCQDRW